jgi:uncharacterized phiE125 gp8 family phage protein
LTIQTAPTQDCVTLADAKAHLRIVTADEDTLIESYIRAATQICEGETWRTFVSTTYDASLECWPSDDKIELLRPPISSVTHIKYTDVDDNQSTLSTDVYQLVSAGGYGYIGLKYNQVWPSDDLAPGYPIEVRYVAGYGGASAVPQRFKAHVLLWTGVLYERREGVEFLQGGELAEIQTLQRIRQMGRAW